MTTRRREFSPSSVIKTRLGVCFLSHDRRELAQQKFSGGYSLGESQGKQLRERGLFFTSFRRRAIKVGQHCFGARLIKLRSQFAESVERRASDVRLHGWADW